MICGTMNLVAIGEMQAGLFTNWLVFHDPFTFLVFFVYFTCAVASVNRAPFDLAEAESELVAGFHTEYSGLRWSFFFMAEYGSMFLVSALAAILFFGGWNGPIPIFQAIGWSYGPNDVDARLTGYIAQLAGVTNLLLKATLGVTVMMWVRWTLPRLRIDQVMTTCLKYCVPLAAICFLGAMLWKVYDMPSPHDFARATLGHTFADVRENWVVEQDRLAVAAKAAGSSEEQSPSDAPASETPAAEASAAEASGEGPSPAPAVIVSAIAEELN
jgi:NADH-quinone oxidoreductase subunit H